MSLKNESWEGTLLDWIEFAHAEYFSPETLRDYDRWLAEQLARPKNVIPFRLVSGKAPKGSEFVRSDDTVLYGADNEPLAGLWGIVSRSGKAPEVGMKELLATGQIPGSWPPKQTPSRFHCERWGPAPLRLKDRGMKIAHLLDAGRNEIPVEPEHLARRAFLTLSLANCFPMPNRQWVEFSREGRVSSDLAEAPEVQSLLFSFVADHMGGAEHVQPLLVSFGPNCPVRLRSDWERDAAAFRFAVRPKSGTIHEAPKPPRASRRPTNATAREDGPRAFYPRLKCYPDLFVLLEDIKAWLAENPGVERLDDRKDGSNPKPRAHFRVDHLEGTGLVIRRPNVGGQWTDSDYTGVFHLNSDTKAAAVSLLVEMAENGLNIAEILEPSVTNFRHWKGNPTGEKPCFIVPGTAGARGLYCYR